jgi:hypothetical protein
MLERGWQNMARRSGTGRGWHGDREGHARAGALGGRARGRKRGRSSSNTGGR